MDVPVVHAAGGKHGEPTGEPPKNGVHDQLLACLESLHGHPV